MTGEQKKFERFRVGFKGGYTALEFSLKDIASIEKQPSGLTRLTTKKGDYFDCTTPVDRLKEMLGWDGGNKEGAE